MAGRFSATLDEKAPASPTIADDVEKLSLQPDESDASAIAASPEIVVTRKQAWTSTGT